MNLPCSAGADQPEPYPSETLRGTGLVVFSPSLVFIAVDNLFGGDGRFPTKVEGREFTHTEQRVINRMLKLALEGYSDARKAINPLEVEYVRSEMQVKFTNITTSPNDIVVNTPFHVEIGNLTGEFNICLPFSMIEPLRELLVNPPLENSRNEDQNWRDNPVRRAAFAAGAGRQLCRYLATPVADFKTETRRRPADRKTRSHHRPC